MPSDQSPLIDEICPSYVGEARIKITLGKDQNPRALAPVLVLLDYSACEETGGIVLPLEIFVRAPTPVNCERSVIRSGTPPIMRLFTPREGGMHFFVVREMFHNNYWGSIRVDVVGERLRSASEL